MTFRILFVAVCLGCTSGPRVFADTPGPVLLTEQRLATLRSRIAADTEPTASAYRALKREADADLQRHPHVPEHWHVPGFYHDAEGHRRAKAGLQEDANAVYRLALVYRMTDDEQYAKVAANLIHAWATGIQSASTKADSTLSFSYHFPAMVIGASLLRGSPHFTAERQAAFEEFLREKALPLNTMNRSNNWGNWGLVLVLSIGAYLDDEALLEAGTQRWKEFIDEQIDDKGHLHHEVTRSGGQRGIWYSHFSLMPQTIAAEILRVRGVDLYDYVSPQGRSLRRAYEQLVPWVVDPSTFPYWKKDPAQLRGVTYYSYFEILDGHWPSEQANALLDRARPATASHSTPVLTFTHGGLLNDDGCD